MMEVDDAAQLLGDFVRADPAEDTEDEVVAVSGL
jgi:hypothetical protein